MTLPELPELSRFGSPWIPELPALPTEAGKSGNGNLDAEGLSRWRLTVAALLGEPWPMPPAIAGRVHLIAVEEDNEPAPADEVAAAVAAGCTAAELSVLLGISRQAATTRLRRLQEAAPAPGGVSQVLEGEGLETAAQGFIHTPDSEILSFHARPGRAPTEEA